ncbi:MAG: sigma-70 family RNA polymerase sigma factor [Myxococcota bacterium]
MFDERLASARQKYPQVSLAPERFAARLARAPDAQEPADLFLAEACLAGDDGALKTLDALLRELARAAGPSAHLDEAVQQVRVRLLVGHAGPPKLAEYAGQGPLAAWLRTTLVHTVAGLERREKPSEPLDSLAMLELPDEAEWPDTALARREARAKLRDALERALQKLSRKERVLLRQHYLDGLTLEQLAAYERVHRATIARWMAAAREALLGALEAETAAMPELWGLVQSRLTLSISRLLDESR